MAWRNQMGYSQYRGRNGGSTVLKIIIALLAVLLIAGLVFVIFISQFMEYTPEGVRFNPPWAHEDEGDLPIASSDVVVIWSEAPSDPGKEDTEPSLLALRAVEVTAQQLRDGTAAQAVADVGGNALVVEMKSRTGALAWQSQAELATTLGVNAANNAVADAVSALAQEGELYLVARVVCFRDSALAKAEIGTLMTRGGNVWFDSQGVCWSSPAEQQATDYLSALCGELAAMGFDEIVLDCAGFPDDGEVNVLAQDDNRPEDLTAPAEAFLKRLSEELADFGVCLSVSTTEAAIQGTNQLSGITPLLLAQYSGRVWLPEVPEAGTIDVLTNAGMEQARSRLVLQVEAGWASPPK